MYTAIFLDAESKKKLLECFDIPKGWKICADHMTTNMGTIEAGPAADFFDQQVDLTVKSVAQNNLVMAVGVDCEVPSVNKIKHITLAFNPQGGKPKMSNQLESWKVLETPIILQGTLKQA